MVEILWLSFVVYLITAAALGVALHFHLKTVKGKKHLEKFKMANLLRILLILSFFMTPIIVFLLRILFKF
jgi:hypothetical protein